MHTDARHKPGGCVLGAIEAREQRRRSSDRQAAAHMVDLDKQLYIEAALAKNLPLWRLENRLSLEVRLTFSFGPCQQQGRREANAGLGVG